MRTTVLCAVLVLVLPTDAFTQAGLSQPSDQAQFSVFGSQPATVMQQGAPHRSPVLAGALSFVVPFGTGSFYSGNVALGVRHAAIGAATAGLFLAHFCLESCTDTQETWGPLASSASLPIGLEVR